MPGQASSSSSNQITGAQTTRRPPRSPGASSKPSSPRSERPNSGHRTSTTSPVRENAPITMSERSKGGRQSKSPYQDPRLAATSRSSTGSGTGKSSGTIQDQEGAGTTDTNTEEDAQETTVESWSEIDSAGQLSQYREKLAKDMERQGIALKSGPPPSKTSTRISPIQEEAVTMSSIPTSSEPLTSSMTAFTDSGSTIRGGMTPGFVAGTPSYPFPRMGSSGFMPSPLHRPFTALSPTAASAEPPFVSGSGGSRLQDKLLSNPATPASTMNFQPNTESQLEENPDFPSPNIYELSLALSAEPGLEAWWNTVVQIMTEYYKAERLALSVPADSTDLQNVPWGQKATYNANQEDELSLQYIARGSSFVPSSMGLTTMDDISATDDGIKLKVPKRPGMQSRHSFTSYENEKQDMGAWTKFSPIFRRPVLFPRSQSSYPGAGVQAEAPRLDTPHMGLNHQALMEHDAEEQEYIPDWQAPPPSENKGRVLNLLQSLDYEADPLIDHHGVTQLLERDRVIALTRTYPYLGDAAPAKSGAIKPPARSHSPEGMKKVRKLRSDSGAKLSNILGNAQSRKSRSQDRRTGPSIDQMLDEERPPRPPTPKYEEYEQAPPSPWSQSPAPSPAIRADPNQNPFFTEAVVDEASFDPSPSPQDYSALGPQEAIGVDNSWTVLHIPLKHILLSKPSGGFKLDSTLMEQKSSGRGRDLDPPTQSSPDHFKKEKQTPIAILSILSPTIPYPSNLRHSLVNLAPHLATSFSLCQHYSNLEAEISGMNRRKPRIAGFGGVDPEGRLVSDSTTSNFAASEDVVRRRSLAGSVTSPSDYSALSRSTTGTPGGTPGWDSHGFGLIADKRPSASSPAPSGTDSYFTTKSTASKIDLASMAQQRTRPGSTVSEKRSSLRISGGKSLSQELGASSPGANERDTTEDMSAADDLPPISIPRRALNRDEQRGESRTPGHGSPRHKTLHSYGGDLASTFPMLPPGSTVGPRGIPSRSDSFPVDPPGMALPSDRLKGLILDSLDAHIFVALPPNGAIVYVNSRFLAYRGQTLAELAVDAFASIHPDDREPYLKAWSHSIRTGDIFTRQVRIRRFDGAYRWFHARAVASRNRRNEVVQFLGSYWDVHAQYMSELKAARQQEIEASEAKHRLLANLIPQIIFTATEDEGITFANDQWLSYTGQSFEDAQGLGFLDYVHPEDISKCRIPNQRPLTPIPKKNKGSKKSPKMSPATHSSTGRTSAGSSPVKTGDLPDKNNIRGVHHALSRRNSSSSDSMYEVPTANLTELAKKGIVKVALDSNGRLSYTTEMRLRDKKGDYRWHLVRCVEIDNTSLGQGVSSYFGSATDINDHKLLEEKLKEAMESKSRFLSNMSHEIRTPLIGISGMVSFLQDTILNEEQRDYTNTIQTSANSLLMIINDILDLSKVDAGMMKLNHEWFHTRSLIEDVNELVSTMAIAKRLELNYIVDEDVPIWIKGDRVRIRQVLLNVIGNAIKFTQAGEVFSRCRVKNGAALDLDENQIMLEFAVIDTGRGFNEEEAKLIFRPFSQIDGSSTRVHGGSGLGLVISRQLVELHGGQMDGTAVPDGGATFTFTAKFGLPTVDDHPDAPISPRQMPRTPAVPEDIPTQPFRQFAISRPLRPTPPPITASPNTIEQDISPAVASSGSSNPSISSTGTRITERSSMSSVNAGLVRFSEAARASGQDLSQLKLEMPSGRSSPGITPIPGTQSQFRPPMFSILVICPQRHSREATAMHIEMTLPKDVPHQITALATAKEAQKLIRSEDPVIFTHVVINLPSAQDIFDVMDEINRSTKVNKTTILILSDSVQRQALVKLVADEGRGNLISESKITYIYKPVKPSRFAVIFDPSNERDLSIDRNRSTAQRIVETQKQSYLDVEKRMGNKGYKVLLVEDNPVNQKVLTKYLEKVGLEVDLAKDGVECTDKVFAHPHGHFSLILCDLHMPRKDGYQACRDIREWEMQNDHKILPIIALSANVMSDVQDKCVEAGFSDYVTKPVDFIELSTALSKFF